VTNSQVLGSVVIPAHNEAAVISRCLDALLNGFSPGELEVVVACNGCTDSTADIVRSSGYEVRVLETEVPSKTAALRAAEEVLTSFPRLYLDADVVLTGAAARQVLDRLRCGPALAGRPPIKYDTERSSALVRSYYRARTEIPAVMNSVWGAGVYGLSEKGRARFASYPDVTADDLFVDQHFHPEEIEIVNTIPVIVTAPRRARDLLRILRRTYLGNSENRLLPRKENEKEAKTSSTVRDLVHFAGLGLVNAMDAAAYAAMAALARLTVVMSPPTGWERDNGSRVENLCRR
jgi:glycosyltransferase involved in cell wall biosynthesis